MGRDIGNCGWFSRRRKNIFYTSFALIAAVCVAPKLRASAPTIEEEVQSLLAKCDVGQAASCSSRDKFFSRGFAAILHKRRADLAALKPGPIIDPLALEALSEARKPNPIAIELSTWLSAMVVISADHVIGIAPRIPKMFYDKPTPTILYKELARLALEQVLSRALEFECFENFVKIMAQRTSSVLFELITQHLKEFGHHIEALPDDDSPRIEFSAKHGPLIMEAICSVISDYAKLFPRAKGNCAAHFSPKFAAKAAKLMTGLNASSRMPISVLNDLQETLVREIIGATEALLETSPDKSVFDTSADATTLALQHFLPVISCAGQLWGFGNGLKDESSFFKKLKTAIQDSEEIMKQISDVKKKKKKSSDAEDSAEKQGPERKKKAPSSAKSFAGHIITQMRKITKKYFDAFGKRETFGNIASPL
ncbi:MAG: hypothetical protein LBG09_03755 [Puniceicoccales bacterium]|jgi:hypothetical protein|nr:hypothetical protein [Puniceicoccales bacterium]